MSKAAKIIRLYDSGKYTFQQIADRTDSCIGYVSAALQRRNGSRECDLRWAKKQWAEKKKSKQSPTQKALRPAR